MIVRWLWYAYEPKLFDHETTPIFRPFCSCHQYLSPRPSSAKFYSKAPRNGVTHKLTANPFNFPAPSDLRCGRPLRSLHTPIASRDHPSGAGRSRATVGPPGSLPRRFVTFGLKLNRPGSCVNGTKGDFGGESVVSVGGDDGKCVSGLWPRALKWSVKIIEIVSSELLWWTGMRIFLCRMGVLCRYGCGNGF